MLVLRYILTFTEQYALNTKIEDQKQVGEILANYFSTNASNIGGNHVTSLNES